MEAINVIQGIRDLHEHSAFKDYAAENPDWAESPSGVEKAISISPSLAYQGAQFGHQLYQDRLARAGSRLSFQNNLDRAAYYAYHKAGGAADTGEPMAEGSFNYAAAEAAGNDMSGRYIQAAESQYGPEFAAQLKNTIRQGGQPNGAPGIWDLNGYSVRQPVYAQVMEGMREDSPVVLTNPETGAKSVVNMRTMPGAERAAWLKERAMYNPIPLKQGENIPEATGPLLGPGGTPTGLQQSTRGGITRSDLNVATTQERDFFSKLPTVQRFQAAEPVYARGKQSVRLGTIPGDKQTGVALALLDNPGAVATEGGVQTVANPGLLSPETQGWLNMLDKQGGRWTPEQRRQIDQSLDITYGDYRRQLQDQITSQKLREKTYSLGETTDLARPFSEERLKELRTAPFLDGGIQPGAGGGTGGASGLTAAQARQLAADPATKPQQHAAALAALSDVDLGALDTRKMTRGQKMALLAELKQRKAAADARAAAAKPGK